MRGTVEIEHHAVEVVDVKVGFRNDERQAPGLRVHIGRAGLFGQSRARCQAVMPIGDVERGHLREGLLQVAAYQGVVHGPQPVPHTIGGAEVLVGTRGRDGVQQALPVGALRCAQQYGLGVDAGMGEVFGEKVLARCKRLFVHLDPPIAVGGDAHPGDEPP